MGNIFFFIFTLVVVAVIIIAYIVAPGPLLLGYVVVGLVVYFAGVTLAGIAKTAPYIYATDGARNPVTSVISSYSSPIMCFAATITVINRDHLP